jgi:hypothetical protein
MPAEAPAMEEQQQAPVVKVAVVTAAMPTAPATEVPV